MEGLEYWTKASNKAQAVDEELLKRGKQTLLPAKMFPRVFQHLAGMGMEVLMQMELDTGYADDDLAARLNQSIRDWDKESKQAAKEKRIATEKQFHQQKTAEKRDTAPGVEDAGARPGALMFGSIAMPAFLLLLGDMLAQRTGYSEVDVLEWGSTFLQIDMSDGEITDRVISLHDQIFDLMCDHRLVTTETWGRLSVFSLKLDIHFLHQFLEANEGRNQLALVKIVQEACTRVLLREMATVSILRLMPSNFIIYHDSVNFVTQLLVDVTTDWDEYQAQHDEDMKPFFTHEAREYEKKISPLWTSFL